MWSRFIIGSSTTPRRLARWRKRCDIYTATLSSQLWQAGTASLSLPLFLLLHTPQLTPSSETTSTALAFLYHYLASHLSYTQTLRAELASVSNIRSHSSLQSLPYLNALITETLRLHPPVPAGLQRNTPKEGVVIDGEAIPGGVTCLAPMWSIARRECFSHSLRYFARESKDEGS